MIEVPAPFSRKFGIVYLISIGNGIQKLREWVNVNTLVPTVDLPMIVTQAIAE